MPGVSWYLKNLLWGPRAVQDPHLKITAETAVDLSTGMCPLAVPLCHRPSRNFPCIRPFWEVSVDKWGWVLPLLLYLFYLFL